MAYDFTFQVIPLAEAIHQQVASEDHELPVVMVVDDEPLIVDSLAAILSTAKMTVLKAYNASSALELAIARLPQLLVTDVAMPGMNGIDLAMAVAEAIPSCKVVLFSAHASTLDLTEARAAGFDFPLLGKPIHPREMLRRISEFLHPESTLKSCRNYAERTPQGWLPQANG